MNRIDVEIRGNNREVLISLKEGLTSQELRFMLEFLEKLGYKYLLPSDGPRTFRFSNEEK